jgi:hypothetical protein
MVAADEAPCSPSLGHSHRRTCKLIVFAIMMPPTAMMKAVDALGALVLGGLEVAGGIQGDATALGVGGRG